MTSEQQQRIDQALGPKNWKTVGTAKIAASGRSLVLEFTLRLTQDKPAYIGLEALRKLLSGDFKDATIYQMEE